MDFYELQKSSLILENIAAAKALLIKDYAEKQKKNVNEIPEEIKKSIWRDPRYQQILDLAKEGKYHENGELHPSSKPGGSKKLPKNEGWIYLLTKLYVIDGCPWEELVSVEMDPESATVGSPTGIYNMMVELKPSLNELPLKNVDAYARIISLVILRRMFLLLYSIENSTSSPLNKRDLNNPSSGLGSSFLNIL